jgi:subtilisin family serine protease
MKKQLLLIIIFQTIIYPAFAQQLNYVQGELLIKPRPGANVQQWAQRYQTFEGRKTNFRIRERISQPMNIWRVQFDFTRVSEFALLDAIRKDKAIAVAQLNHRVALRSTLPNDLDINMQWQYLNVGQSGGLPGMDMDADLAWDVTTGGLTPSGDTIVVCIIDDGFNDEHPDFADNIWINHAETPDNGIDEDGNGFTDDYFGWNTALDNDDVFDRANHGTAVAGIIGAQGNNELGVSGVNWDVKMMIVKGGTGIESEVIEAYSYPLSLRKKYNETDGQEGAFVVATNSSWGTTFLFPEDAPLWCAMYDSLGIHGILNVGAAPNQAVDVDVSGDLPSTCPSDYLLAVTNITDQGELYEEAGFGALNMDLGAFGEGVWTVDAPDGYGPFDGTSAATPHVTGAIALLYSAPCASFADLYRSDPRAAALLVREYILEGTTFNENLQGITTTWGHLNLNNSLQLLLDQCSECFPPTSLSVSNISADEATLAWTTNSRIQQVDLRWRAAGDAAWTEMADVESPFRLENLDICTDYEFQLQAFCETEVLDYTEPLKFRTDGCCEAPQELTISSIGSEIAVFNWQSVLFAERYTLRYRAMGDPDWNTRSTADTSFIVNGLMACTTYEVQLSTTCNAEPSAFSQSFLYQTPGCGACLDEDYCNPSNMNAEEEWIALVKVNDFENASESDEGYGDYTAMAGPTLFIGERYEMELRPGFRDVSYTEAFSVWIDFDQSGSFDITELVFEQEANALSFKDSIEISAAALPGSTRMRVAMQFLNPGGPCTFFNSGEVEDYCVEIESRTSSASEALFHRAASIRLHPNPFAEQLRVSLELREAQDVVTVRVMNATGQQLQTRQFQHLPRGTHPLDLNLQNAPAGIYFIQCHLANGASVTRRVAKR